MNVNSVCFHVYQWLTVTFISEKLNTLMPCQRKQAQYTNLPFQIFQKLGKFVDPARDKSYCRNFSLVPHTVIQHHNFEKLQK